MFQWHACKLAKLNSACIAKQMTTANKINIYIFTFCTTTFKNKELIFYGSIHSVNGQFQKISIPNHGRLSCFNPPLPSEIPECVTPSPHPCPQNSIIVKTPPALRNFQGFFGGTFSTWQRLYEQMSMNLCLPKAVI